jgi:hypothetical protein
MQRKGLKQLWIISVPKCFEILIVKNTTFLFLICIATVYVPDLFIHGLFHDDRHTLEYELSNSMKLVNNALEGM